MPKVSVVTLDKSHAVKQPAGYSGLPEALAYFDDEKAPLHLHLHRIAPSQALTIGPMATDCVAYVWHGAVERLVEGGQNPPLEVLEQGRGAVARP